MKMLTNIFEKENEYVDHIMGYLVLIALYSLAMFSFTSLALSSLFHIFIALPAMYFTYKSFRSGLDRLTISSLALIGTVLAIIISIIFSDMTNKLQSVLKIKFFLIGIFSVFAIKRTLDLKILSEKQIKILVNIFLWSVLIASISGIIALHTGWHYLRFKPAAENVRAAGMYGMAITFGNNIQFIAIILLSAFFWNDSLKKIISKKLIILFFVAAFLGLWFSYTRGALLGFVLAIPAVCFPKYKKTGIALYSASIGLLIVLITILSVDVNLGNLKTNRLFQPLNSESNMIRVSQMETAWYAFLENPITGIGFRNLEPNVARIKAEHGIAFPDFYGHAHNNFFEFLAGCGIVGFLFFSIFMVSWFVELVKRNDVITRLLIPFYLSFFFSGLFQTTIIDSENLYIIMILYTISQISFINLPKED